MSCARDPFARSLLCVSGTPCPCGGFLARRVGQFGRLHALAVHLRYEPRLLNAPVLSALSVLVLVPLRVAALLRTVAPPHVHALALLLHLLDFVRMSLPRVASIDLEVYSDAAEPTRKYVALIFA